MAENALLDYENKRIKSAIIVDFILSIEIVIIALSTVVDKPLNIQIIVVSIVAIISTIGVYGLVALIVRMDDLGFKLIASGGNKGSISHIFGTGLVKTLPYVIRGLAIIGTIAMVLVAGDIYVHNVPFVNELFHSLPKILGEFIVGLIVGFTTLFVSKFILKIFSKKER